MSAVARLFGEWWSERYPDDQSDGTEFDKEDLAEAFAAGWEACYHARWEPVGGLPHARKKVFVVHEEPDMGYYGGGEVYGVFRDEARAEALRAEKDPNDHGTAVVDEIEIG